jgi:hypothetical protein
MRYHLKYLNEKITHINKVDEYLQPAQNREDNSDTQMIYVIVMEDLQMREV